MTDRPVIERWPEIVRQRYENYLKASFFFKDSALRASFQEALQESETLLKGPFPEPARGFRHGVSARALARECFPQAGDDLLPAMIEGRLYVHQEQAIRATHLARRNVVVATGTASGKTESFLYPILFELFGQHLRGELQAPGVRAMILYPMNALANDQRERLGKICRALHEADSTFNPTFGQYIGQTPRDAKDTWRNAPAVAEERRPGELIFRTEMRSTPPHVLLTNYSMLEYLLLRPEDSPLFDGDRGRYWQFIVLDEAHQYRGAKGMEMSMLMRRLKQRLRAGGRRQPFRCIATSATISSRAGAEDKCAVAEFAAELFGEPFAAPEVIFGESHPTTSTGKPRRYHAFLRALEGAFLVHRDGADVVVLNRKSEDAEGTAAVPLEIALCKECGQHYYVGRERGGRLREAVRDPSHDDFGVDYYLPLPTGDAATHVLCRRCGALSTADTTACDCAASIAVKHSAPHEEHKDQLQKCETCGYQRGGIGDPVQEIVHGSDGPNAVIATALHELLPQDRRKVLAFADSRQEAAFFAWYAEDSYEKVRDRNLILRALQAGPVAAEGLSINDLQNRLLKQWQDAELFGAADTGESRNRRVLVAVLREALTDERRLSLAGVGLMTWFVRLPADLALPPALREAPWRFTEQEAEQLLGVLVDELRIRNAMELPAEAAAPAWSEVSPWPQIAYSRAPSGKQKNVRQWGSSQSALVTHYLARLLAGSGLNGDQRRQASTTLMQAVWDAVRNRDRACSDSAEHVLSRAATNGAFRLNPRWLRVRPARSGELWECDTCATVSSCNIRNVCPRHRCPGVLQPADHGRLARNHYRMLYENRNLPPSLRAEEHTAQIDSDEARQRQERFKNGATHLLSSSTTFEVGVDLGDLDVVFLRNVPPEPFNYTQRVGRAGRRDEHPGLALTYCRRNPHDLYHYAAPERRVLKGEVRPPRLKMTNEKIIARHVAAAALSAFFKVPDNRDRFETVETLVGDWSSPRASADLRAFCAGNTPLQEALLQIVPRPMHTATGLVTDQWIDTIAAGGSRLAAAEAEVCSDYQSMERRRQELFDQRKGTNRVEARMKTIAGERVLDFLSRKAVIPKYGFPVDVVELDTRSGDRSSKGVLLQRDLSQAIAEYAPGGKVVANKLEWESCGVKKVAERGWPVRHYRYDQARSFEQWDEVEQSAPPGTPKYLIPQFGFVTPLFKQPAQPRGRARRLYTTRPFFRGFEEDAQPAARAVLGAHLTRAVPGVLVILCEGRERAGFHLCRSCGAHLNDKKAKHKSPSDVWCDGTLERFSLGHELVTDVVRMQFPALAGEWTAYSVAYAMVLGAAETLDVPDSDLNVTITAGSAPGESAIVLYDDVPGGAGLVAQLEHEEVFAAVLRNARERVMGTCGCDASCYGCLRSYRNQFAHPHLDRGQALEILERAGHAHI